MFQRTAAQQNGGMNPSSAHCALIVLSKQALFKKMGFTIEDAEYLKAEYEKQALEKYCNGEYTLDKLNEYGQRITIPIYLTKNGAATIIITGWMVRKDGLITNTTPFSGKRRG